MRRLLGTAVLALSLLATGTVTPGHAQSTPAGGAQGGSTTTTDNNDDGGMDMGWIGLLGLAVLLGMRRREPTRVDRVDTTASTRARV
jgi:MYXO-CTERM domain-containing protein